VSATSANPELSATPPETLGAVTATPKNELPVAPMKILQVISVLAPRYGGPSFACPELSRELVRQGHEVTVCATNVDGAGHLDVPTDRPVVSDGVTFRYFHGSNPGGFYVFSPAMWRGLRDMTADFDIAHVWSVYGFSNTAASYWCRQRGVPYVAFPHGSLDPFLRRRNRPRKWIYTKLFAERDYRRADAVLFTTAEEKRLASDWSGLKTPGGSAFVPKQVIAYTGIGSEWLREPDADAGLRFREKFPQLKNKRLVVYFGRLNFKKGLDILARAFALLARNRDDLHLVIAGPDTEGYEPKVREWLSEGGVLEKSTFTGMLSGPDRCAALQQAEVFALPSYTENFGQVVFEAMASGVPVVISDQVNIWPEVTNAHAGLVVPCDPKRTAEALQTLLDDPVRAKQMGIAGRRWVCENLSWPVVTERMAMIYADVISDHRSRVTRKLSSQPGTEHL
jgi:glycosyltransferase involved in cell wall biosynthesis